MALMSTCLKNGEIVINSGDRLTIETAADFLRLLREGFEASKNVSVEFEAEVEIDITVIHALCSACKTAAASGKIFSYQGPRPLALADIIEDCGIELHAVCKHNSDSTCIWFGGEK